MFRWNCQWGNFRLSHIAEPLDPKQSYWFTPASLQLNQAWRPPDMKQLSGQVLILAPSILQCCILTTCTYNWLSCLSDHWHIRRPLTSKQETPPQSQKPVLASWKFTTSVKVLLNSEIIKSVFKYLIFE